MKVSNRGCIRRLSLRSLLASRTRNIVAVLAIALTAALLMLFVSLSAHVITSVGEMLKELEALGG